MATFNVVTGEKRDKLFKLQSLCNTQEMKDMMTALARVNKNDTNPKAGNWTSFKTAFENFGLRHSGISSSHAWSAHPLFLMPRILGGIRQTAPAWSKVSFNPLFIEDSGSIVWPTPRGKIRLEWKKLPDGSFEKKLDLPEGIELSE